MNDTLSAIALLSAISSALTNNSRSSVIDLGTQSMRAIFVKTSVYDSAKSKSLQTAMYLGSKITTSVQTCRP